MTLLPQRSLKFLGLLLATAAGLSASASAQGFNVDFDDPFQGLPPTPSTYPAAGTSGVWNQVDAGLMTPTNLVDKAGAATGVTMTLSSLLSITLGFDNTNITGVHESLMEDIVYGGSIESITFTGLANGTYNIYTYALAPDSKIGFITDVDVAESTDGNQTVGGQFWNGGHQQGVSYALHNAVVTTGTLTIAIGVSVGDLSVNGVQIEPAGDPGAAYCFGDGTGANCPCSAFGGPGQGCLTTSGTGATLSASGGANVVADSFVLSVTGGPANKPGIFFQGPNMLSVPAGDGILCSNASMRYGVNSLDATGSVTQTGFGVNAMPGQTLNYQYWFRDTGNACGMGGFNFSNGWFVTWQ